jgi:hypothetical protein
MRHLGSKCHIKDYVTPQYYNIFLVSQRCHIKEVRLYSTFQKVWQPHFKFWIFVINREIGIIVQNSHML